MVETHAELRVNLIDLLNFKTSFFFLSLNSVMGERRSSSQQHSTVPP